MLDSIYKVTGVSSSLDNNFDFRNNYIFIKLKDFGDSSIVKEYPNFKSSYNENSQADSSGSYHHIIDTNCYNQYEFFDSVMMDNWREWLKYGNNYDVAKTKHFAFSRPIISSDGKYIAIEVHQGLWVYPLGVFHMFLNFTKVNGAWYIKNILTIRIYETN
ncbi:MAG TPA: hypothetical protein VEC12_10410 [Bacteroidia bacterium]|nr:hypothetical protein [Bacteroidia bacterium]